MLLKRPAMTDAERQRKFRRAHPGYYARLQARRRAATKQAAALRLAQWSAEWQAANAREEAARAQAAAKPVLMLPAPVLMLPAPVEMSAFEVNLPVQPAQPVAIERASA